MNIISSPYKMPSSNLLHPLQITEQSFNRKRYLEDIDALQPSKRSRTAPSSPPFPEIFKARSVSPVPQTTTNQIFPKPIGSYSPPQSTLSLTKNIQQLPSIESLTQHVKEHEYLRQNDRYGNSHHSHDYPDTCITDDGWRLNLEGWIKKHFPEKLNNLKNLLRYDKPGFDLLNDAILLSELKDQLDDQRSQRKPLFTSKISKKMVSRPSSSKLNYYQRASHIQSDHSDDESFGVQFRSRSPSVSSNDSSPISHSIQPLNPRNNQPYESNYTYNSTGNLSAPSSPASYQSKLQANSASKPPTRRVSFSAMKTHTRDLPSTPISTSVSSFPTPTSLSSWKGHHKTEDSPVILKTNTFIHTQNHKGPNHTYTIHHHNQSKRVCASCGSDQSPCWRPSWSTAAGQLCNSCGLRYKKTGARCTVDSCRRIPAKGEWTAIKSRGKIQIKDKDGHSQLGYSCLHCGGEIEVKEKSK